MNSLRRQSREFFCQGRELIRRAGNEQGIRRKVDPRAPTHPMGSEYFSALDTKIINNWASASVYGFAGDSGAAGGAGITDGAGAGATSWVCTGAWRAPELPDSVRKHPYDRSNNDNTGNPRRSVAPKVAWIAALWPHIVAAQVVSVENSHGDGSVFECPTGEQNARRQGWVPIQAGLGPPGLWFRWQIGQQSDLPRSAPRTFQPRRQPGNPEGRVSP